MLKVSITSLGCPRNLVDSEVIAGSLKKAGFTLADIDDGVDVSIINTCSFVESAREESIDTILAAAELKREGRIKHLVVCGCLPQLYKEKLLKELPEVDLIAGTSDILKIVPSIKKLSSGGRSSLVSSSFSHLYDEKSPRMLLTPGHYAYVKISEGCDNLCNYCRIPALRGRLRSRSIGSVIEEVRKISRTGAVKEVNLIGQDTTLFGKDRYGSSRLAGLLKKMAALKNSIRWIRVLYTHPAHYDDDLISVVRDQEKICKYLDLPIQHINDAILKRMNRHTTAGDITALVETLRSEIAHVALRTSVIVGYPGESECDFQELLDFIRWARFERLGAFLYSREEGTKAGRMPHQVPEKVKQERFDELMKLQQRISEEQNRSFLGKTIKVLIEECLEDGDDMYVGRSEHDAPEVDGSVYVSGRNMQVGEFYDVRVTGTMEYDLKGEKV